VSVCVCAQYHVEALPSARVVDALQVGRSLLKTSW